MKTDIVIKRTLKTASSIFFNELRLKEIAFIDKGQWVKREVAEEEYFNMLIQQNKTLYKKLFKYKDRLYKDLTLDKLKEVNYKINCLLNGTYKEKYIK